MRELRIRRNKKKREGENFIGNIMKNLSLLYYLI